VACVLSAYQWDSQITVEEPATKEVLITSQTPDNTSTRAEVKPHLSAQPKQIFKLTAYCPCAICCGKTDGVTSTGVIATAGRTIAVDPEEIPYGSEVIINDHTYIAEDCGGAIKGNRIDIYFDTHQEALEFGVQYVEVEVK
jgi:3D (Asp-Asp-Asp) domain-containing protein